MAKKLLDDTFYQQSCAILCCVQKKHSVSYHPVRIYFISKPFVYSQFIKGGGGAIYIYCPFRGEGRADVPFTLGWFVFNKEHNINSMVNMSAWISCHSLVLYFKKKKFHKAELHQYSFSMRWEKTSAQPSCVLRSHYAGWVKNTSHHLSITPGRHTHTHTGRHVPF